MGTPNFDIIEAAKNNRREFKRKEQHKILSTTYKRTKQDYSSPHSSLAWESEDSSRLQWELCVSHKHYYGDNYKKSFRFKWWIIFLAGNDEMGANLFKPDLSSFHEEPFKQYQVHFAFRLTNQRRENGMEVHKESKIYA